jgi:hypothetical protein
MKGPYQRLKYDLRRLWECPECQRRERTAGTVTFRHCPCQLNKVAGQPVVMKLIEDGVQRLVPTVTLHHDPLAPAAITQSPLSSGETEPPAIETSGPTTAS